MVTSQIFNVSLWNRLKSAVFFFFFFLKVSERCGLEEKIRRQDFILCIIHQTMFIQTTSQLPSVQNDVLTGQYAGLHLYFSCNEYILFIFFVFIQTQQLFVSS